MKIKVIIKSFYKNKFGLALVMVISIIVVAIILSGTLYFYNKNQNVSFELIENETKALFAAKSLLQMVIYKYRVLPTEFYIIASATRHLNSADASKFINSWLDEFRSDRENTNGSVIVNSLSKFDKKNYSVGVSSFTLITRQDFGYKKDYLYVEVWGQCDGVKKVLSEMLEVELSR